MNNRDDLRTQIIEAMREHNHCYVCGDTTMEELFDGAVMPVLDAAMKAGELLVHRATAPQQSVNEAIFDWLENLCFSIANILDEESTVSKRMLLNILYIMEEHGLKALADARTSKGLKPDTGMPVPGLTIPKKVKP